MELQYEMASLEGDTSIGMIERRCEKGEGIKALGHNSCMWDVSVCVWWCWWADDDPFEHESCHRFVAHKIYIEVYIQFT